MATSNDRDEPSLDPTRIRETLEQNLDIADGLRLEGLLQLRSLQIARKATYEREHSRLQKKLGPTHPEVQRLEAKIALVNELAEAARADVARAKVKTPEPSKTGWIVHGHISDAQGNPRRCLAVQVSVTGKPIQAEETRPSDEEGYYLTRVEVPKELADGRVALRVVDQQGAFVTEVAPGVTPRAGGVDFIDIVISQDCRG